MPNKLTHLGVIAVLLGGLLGLLWACRHDALPPSDGPEGPITGRSDCAVFLTYEVETTTYARLLNVADSSLLQPEDHLLMLPHRERQRVEACYKSDGSRELILTQLTPLNPIEYPENTIGSVQNPVHSQVKIVNGTATYYDQYGAVMLTVPADANQQAVLDVIHAATTRKALSSAELDLAIGVLRDSNLIETPDPGSNLLVLRTTAADGSQVVQVVDKTTQATVGHFTYSPEGKMTHKMLLKVEGSAEIPLIRSVLVESPFRAVSSAQIPLRLVSFSQIDNFNLATN